MTDRAICIDEMTAQLEIMESILNNMNTAVYVSDLATNEILFANMALQQLLGDNSFAGRICWEAIGSENRRCAFCRIPYLLKNPGKECQWETRIGDSRFLLHDSIIPWADGRLAHMQCMVEIVP